MEQLNALALDLAGATMNYARKRMHADASGLREDKRAADMAYDFMMDLQNKMWYAAEALAQEEA